MGFRGAALAEFFRRLLDGDPVALGIVAGFLIVAASAGVIVYLVHLKLKREDEARARRHGRKR
jgi:hypothetical protein